MNRAPDPHCVKYFASVPRPGLAPGVSADTTTIMSADTMVIGTTGRKPATIIPAAARVTTGAPPGLQTGISVPGGGAGMVVCTTATNATAAAVHTVAASAPHFVLPFQNSAATSSGASAE